MLGSLLDRAPAAAATAPLLLDVPLPLTPGDDGMAASAAVGCMRLELSRLAAGSFHSAAGVAAEAGANGFVSLKEFPDACGKESTFAGIGSRAAWQLAALSLLPLPWLAPVTPALPSFLLRPAEPPCADTAAAGADGSAHQFITLEAPVLLVPGPACTAAPVPGAPISAFPDLFQPVAVPKVAVELCFAPEGCQPASLSSLLAQDLVLDDGGLVLPAVVVEEDGGEAASGGQAWAADRSQHGKGPVHQGAGKNMCHACVPAVQAWRCCRSSGPTAAASQPTPPTWLCTLTGGCCCWVGRLPVWHCPHVLLLPCHLQVSIQHTASSTAARADRCHAQREAAASASTHACDCIGGASQRIPRRTAAAARGSIPGGHRSLTAGSSSINRRSAVQAATTACTTAAGRRTAGGRCRQACCRPQRSASGQACHARRGSSRRDAVFSSAAARLPRGGGWRRGRPGRPSRGRRHHGLQQQQWRHGRCPGAAPPPALHLCALCAAAAEPCPAAAPAARGRAAAGAVGGAARHAA